VADPIESASDLVTVFLVGVSLAVAAVPEGLPAILSVVLALGVQRMARKNAIVKRLSSVETLGSASVICSDKTGTLTKSEMTIEKVITPSVAVDITGAGYDPTGEVLCDGEPLDDPELVEEVAFVLGGGSLASDASIYREDGVWKARGDPTEAAFLVAERKLGIDEVRRRRFRRDGRIDVVAKGAPDVLLGRCSHERVRGEERPLTEERRREILADVERLADLALRTLAVAYRPLPDHEPPEPDESIERDLVYVGMVGIIDPPREEVRAAIAEAKEAGVRVIMITGDHPRTALRIASDLGIAAADARALTGAELEEMDDETLREEAATVDVFARVAPVHKLRIVDALQAEGNIVAMTGDGVNDAPALKSADIGVAMGIT